MTRRFEQDPRAYNDYISESVFLLLTQSTLPKERNVENAAKRMAFIPKVVAAAKESLKDPPRVFVETAIRQNRGAIAFYESGLFELTGETPGLSELRAGQQAGRRRAEGLPDLPRKGPAAAGERRLAASARSGSIASWSWNWTPA